MNKILKRLITTALFVVMFTMAFKSTTPVQAATSTVTITYQANGGTVYATGPEGTKQTVKKDTNVRLAPPSIARNGYILLGFDKDKNAPFPSYLVHRQYKFSSNVTLYAIWVKRAEIYDRYGDSFSYGVNVSIASGTLDLFSRKNWIGQSTYVKNTRVNQLARQLAGIYGITNMPKVAKGLPAGYNSNTTCGLYRYSTNTLYLNPKLYEDLEFFIDGKWVLGSHLLAKTIAHELRHAYQYQRAVNPSCRTDFLYGYNMEIYGYGNYISTKTDASGNIINFNEYQDQLVEAEAFGIEKLLDTYLK